MWYAPSPAYIECSPAIKQWQIGLTCDKDKVYVGGKQEINDARPDTSEASIIFT